MAAIATPFVLSPQSHDAIVKFFVECYDLLDKQWAIRQNMEKLDRMYIREVDYTAAQIKAKRANVYNFDPTKFQNIIVPIVMPQVESAVAYQTQVFLTGNPIFGVVASPENQDAALQLESVIEDQERKMGWRRQFIKFFRDGFKYNISALEVDWHTITTPAFDTDTLAGNRVGAKVKEVPWEGNKIERWDMYNTFWDTRYDAPEICTRGEFAGNTRLVSRTEFKHFLNTLPQVQRKYIRKALESGIQDTYYIPTINPDTIVDETVYKRSTNWLAWMGLMGEARKIDYKDFYELSCMYARIIPSDFSMGVSQPNTPQIWKFYVVNRQVCVYAERMTNAHNYLPVVFGQPFERGLGYQDKSLAADVAPMQAVASALVNANIASRRRAISDRVIYDPSRISEIHINSDSPTAKIPLRPAAFGRNPAESVYAFPYREDQSANNWQDIQFTKQFSDQISGQNPARQGQFVKGNKTKVEYQDVQGNATARDQMVAIGIQSQVMVPVQEIVKTNILQYQGAASLYNSNQEQIVDVDPVRLRKAIMAFRMSDGLIPSDKLISGDDWGIAIQSIGASPQLAGAYNLAPMFSYLMKVRGANLKPFEKSEAQIAYEQAVGAWQQAIAPALEIAAKNGTQLSPEQLPPQPKPEDYGYQPNPTGNQPTGGQ